VVRTADTATVQELLDAGAQVLEVLPEQAYRREHLPGARNIPLPQLTDDALAAAQLDRDRPIVVYCYDHECDLSSRAAALLVALGCSDVYDYADSKTAWMGAGLPVEGTARPSERAGAIARLLPTCSLDHTVGELRARFNADGLCAVVDDDDVVLGVVRSDVVALDDATQVRTVMHPGPPSVRPSVTASKLADDMARDGRRYVLVTTSHGRLLGVITPGDLHGHH
jgi:rhodanese-related sulfurtransferase